jgi:hypothetical protein
MPQAGACEEYKYDTAAARTRDHGRDVVGRRVVEVVGDVGREEAAVRDVEGHVAEGQQLEEQQDEEEQREPLLDRLRAVAQVEEGQACTAAYRIIRTYRSILLFLLRRREGSACMRSSNHPEQRLKQYAPPLGCMSDREAEEPRNAHAAEQCTKE